MRFLYQLNARGCLNAVSLVLGILLLVHVSAEAEFLSPLGNSDKYGCSLSFEPHLVTDGGQSRVLTEQELTKLKKRLKRKKNKPGMAGKNAKSTLNDLNKCIKGTLRHLDPCSELGSIASTSELQAQVINGRLCDWTNSPLVKIVTTFQDTTEESCSGVALSDHVVLTAQHCVFDPDGDAPLEVKVYLDSFDQTMTTYEPDDIIADPTYFDQGNSDLARYDIAALAFIDPLPVSKTARFLSVNAELQEGERALIAGFGRDESGNPAGFDLIAGFLRVTTDRQFSVDLKFNGDPGESGACTGDSGGPLLIERNGEWRVAGVASYAQSESQDACVPPTTIHYTKHTDCDVRELFADFLCELPYYDPSQDGECIFKACE